MKLTTKHWIGIVFCIAMIVADIAFFSESKMFYFVLGIAVIVAILPFLTDFLTQVGREKEKEEMFLEFTRSLVSSVRAGNPISRSIIHMRGKNFGSLTPHTQKLADQIALGITVRQALQIFASDIGNNVINRSVALIIEAEESGGEIDKILESTAKSVSETEDVKKERRSSMYSLVVQGYIIFFIFLVIMMIVQYKFIPTLLATVAEAGAGGTLGGIGGGLGLPQSTTPDIAFLGTLFLVMVIVQGFFCGLVIGKLSEGTIKSGIKHSAIISAMAYLLVTGMQAFFV